MKKNRLFILGLASLMSLGLASCNGGSHNGEKIEHHKESYYESIDSNYDFYSRERMKITMMVPTEAGYSDALMKKVEEATNTTIELKKYQMDAYSNAILDSFTSPSSMPDIYCRVPDIEVFKEQEAAYELYDLLMQYAPDYRKNLSVQDWMQLTDATTHGIYSISNIREPEYQLSYLMRKDWLKKVQSSLSFDVDVDNPDLSWDQFTEILTHFRDDDPNGNGSKDELPFSVENISYLRYLFGINTSYYFSTDLETGEYQAVVDHKNYKKYLSSIQDLYAGKLLDNQYITAKVESLMSANKLGACITYAEYAQTSLKSLTSATDDSGKTNPNYVKDAEWVSFKLTGPKCADNKTYSAVPSAAGLVHGFVVSSQVSKERAIELVRILNWFYREGGETLFNYGVENEHYTLQDGKKVIKEQYASFESARSAGLLYSSMPIHWMKDSYIQMVTGGKALTELDKTQKAFYDALGIGKFNFQKQSVSINTSEWSENSQALMNQLSAFEANVIKGQIDDVKLNGELDKVINAFAKASQEANEVYAEIYDICK